METPASIREFWFGVSLEDWEVAQEKSSLWWSKSEAVDREIALRFESLVAGTERGGLDTWAVEPEGLLALILLTDQFPRNIYRGHARSFAFDPIALELCKRGLAEGSFARLRPIERVFCYLPLEHSEVLEDQERSLTLFEELAAGLPEAGDLFAGYLDYARQHREVIARFGRFPHRNPILGRSSTPEEEAFLKQPGSSF